MTERDTPDGDAFVRDADETPFGGVRPADEPRGVRRPGVGEPDRGRLRRAVPPRGRRVAGDPEVRERGERLERYRFFDDPFNDGEHAVFGQHRGAQRVRRRPPGRRRRRGNDETIDVDRRPHSHREVGVQAVSGERPSGVLEDRGRATLHRRVERHRGRDRKRGRGRRRVALVRRRRRRRRVVPESRPDTPLSVFPEAVRESIADAVDDDAYPIAADVDLDPFSREAYDHLESVYRDEGRRDLFSAITDRDHLRVTSYVVDVGEGSACSTPRTTGARKSGSSDRGWAACSASSTRAGGRTRKRSATTACSHRATASRPSSRTRASTPTSSGGSSTSPTSGG